MECMPTITATPLHVNPKRIIFPLPSSWIKEGRAEFHWKGEETELLKIKFQLRGGVTKKALTDAVWMGPHGEDSYYENSGETIRHFPKNASWLQYKATLVSPYGCGSPKLKEVRIDL